MRKGRDQYHLWWFGQPQLLFDLLRGLQAIHTTGHQVVHNDKPVWRSASLQSRYRGLAAGNSIGLEPELSDIGSQDLPRMRVVIHYQHWHAPNIIRSLDVPFLPGRIDIKPYLETELAALSRLTFDPDRSIHHLDQLL